MQKGEKMKITQKLPQTIIKFLKGIFVATNLPQRKGAYRETGYAVSVLETDSGEDAAIYSCSSKNELSVRISAAEQLIKENPQLADTYLAKLDEDYPMDPNIQYYLMCVKIKLGDYSKANNYRKLSEYLERITKEDSNYYLFLLYELAPDKLPKEDQESACELRTEDIFPSNDRRFDNSPIEEDDKAQIKEIRINALKGAFKEAYDKTSELDGVYSDEIEAELLAQLVNKMIQQIPDKIANILVDINDHQDDQGYIIMKAMSAEEIQCAEKIITENRMSIQVYGGEYKGERYAFFRQTPKELLDESIVRKKLATTDNYCENKNFYAALEEYMNLLNGVESLSHFVNKEQEAIRYAKIAYCYYNARESLSLEEIERGLIYTKLAESKREKVGIPLRFPLDNVITQLEACKRKLTNGGQEQKTYRHGHPNKQKRKGPKKRGNRKIPKK